MPIAMARTKMMPSYRQCADCEGWTDSPLCTVTDNWDEREVCADCAKRYGWHECSCCDEFVSPDEQYTGPDESIYCEECYYSEFSMCEECNEMFENEDIVECSRYTYSSLGSQNETHHYCESCAERKGWRKCESCDTWYGPDDWHIAPDGDAYCSDCFYEYYDYCAQCGEVFCRDDMVADDCELYCTGCAPDDEYSDNFSPSRFRNRSGRTTGMGSERCYGLELETDDCNGYHNLANRTAWGAKNDPTCCGKELYSSILDGDEGLAEIIKLTDMADKNGWEVGSRCGYHLHIDMRQENDDSLFAVAYAYRATQELWHSFVKDHRHNNTYCHTPCWGLRDIASYDGRFRNFVREVCRDRYEWVNLQAYSEHTTFEIRLHHASLDENEICNWVKAHTRFVDWAATNGLDAVMNKVANLDYSELFDLIAREAWQDSELRDYYTEKAGGVCCAA